MPSASSESGLDSAVGEPPMFRPPRVGPHARTTLVVIGVVALVVVAGVVVLAFRSEIFGPPASPPTAKLGLATPTFATILCSNDGEVYDLTYFPIQWVSGSINVTTAQFGLSILSIANSSISPDGAAPLPSPNLPCAAAVPSSWYAELYLGGKGTAATFPEEGTAGASVWSNATSAPVTISAGMNFILITDGDFTGSGDHLSSFSTGNAVVSLAGNTTFPTYHHP